MNPNSAARFEKSMLRLFYAQISVLEYTKTNNSPTIEARLEMRRAQKKK
jgi:hypothetical protein